MSTQVACLYFTSLRFASLCSTLASYTVVHCILCIRRKGHCTSEQRTNRCMYLVKLSKSMYGINVYAVGGPPRLQLGLCGKNLQSIVRPCTAHGEHSTATPKIEMLEMKQPIPSSCTPSPSRGVSSYSSRLYTLQLRVSSSSVSKCGVARLRMR
ncbi:hypothetical protein CYLTODRAFT_31375 [Cylindrobasidium torrendii FP15055 ss-10]|uniref:Uncharacterized protein n=1 Tax=Cylindrobasidium torrendii FP15055 ss-10 TaxID=1314674 RepID=A0A0D7B8D3_9AGAR|nr:hypothetical protein CYLTODRAFT_31375 [Cylindrobasidium torrendii FP15055 ss-10]